MKRLEELYFVTGNHGKAQEAQAILEFPIKTLSVDLDEIQDMDLERIVSKKAVSAFKIVKRPVIVDDAGLFIEAWNGFPGAFIKYVDTSGGPALLLKMMAKETNRTAIFKAAIGFCNGQTTHTFMGEVKGSIACEVKGRGGWGFDPIFTPIKNSKTFSEMGEKEKNKISHRRRALDNFRQYLLDNNLIAN